MEASIKYLRSTWYVAAYSNDVLPGKETDLFHRKLLDEDIMLFRRKNGELVAMKDRCPHRFAPLHMGRVVDDSVQCGYHGLRFDCSGACVENPHGQGQIPRNAVVTTFRVEERYGLIWIWMGEAASADATLIPDLDYLTDPERAVVSGYHLVNCNYELVGDNLADLTHIQYVHGGYQTSDEFGQAQYKTMQVGRRVENKYFLYSVKVSPLWGRYLKNPELVVDRWMETIWDAPGLFTISAGVTRPGDSRENRLGSVQAAHLLTPETALTTHYFYAHTRDYNVDEQATDAVVREWQRVGFKEQDQPMLEAVQQRMVVADLASLHPVLLSTDAGAMRIRRLLSKLIAEESNQTSPEGKLTETRP